MTLLSLIAIIDQAGGLGKNQQLLCHLPADLAHFKKITLGKPIIMGRKTFAAIGRILPGRPNIIVSHQQLTIPGATVVSSLDAALAMSNASPEVVIIGGGQLFAEALPVAQQLYLTVIHHRFDADVFFPPLDHEHWCDVETVFRARDEQNPFDLTFHRYQRCK